VDYAVERPGGLKINRLWTMPCIFWHREVAVAKNKSKRRGRSGRSAHGGNGGCGANSYRQQLTSAGWPPIGRFYSGRRTSAASKELVLPING
jgi:hypothetical protein